MDVAKVGPEVRERVEARRSDFHPFQHLEGSRTALIVIDMQEAFLAENAPAYIPSAKGAVPAINRVAEILRTAGGLVVWVISTYGPDPADRWPILFDHLFTGERSKALHEALTEGSPGHQLWTDLDRRPEDIVVTKNRSSAFLGSRGALERLLAEHGIDSVLIAGTATSVCCEATAREASMRDFKTIMVTDACAGVSPAADQATFTTFIQSFGDIATTEEIGRRLARPVLAPTAAGPLRRKKS